MATITAAIPATYFLSVFITVEMMAREGFKRTLPFQTQKHCRGTSSVSSTAIMGSLTITVRIGYIFPTVSGHAT